MEVEQVLTKSQPRNKALTLFLNLLPFIILTIFLVVMTSYVVITEGDDTANIERAQAPLFHYLRNLYLNWSGRATANILIYYFPKWPTSRFHFMNTVMGVALVYSLAIHLFGRKFLLRDDASMRLVLWFLCLGFGFFDESIIIPGMFWITGSISYMWIVTAASVALIPFSDKFIHMSESLPGGPIWAQPIYWLAAVVACNGLEQTALIVVGLSFLALVAIYWRTRKIDPYLTALFVVMSLSAVVLFIAPGNQARFDSEVKTWWPNFQKQSLGQRVMVGLEWMTAKLTRLHRGLLLLFYGLLAVHMATKIDRVKGRGERFLDGFTWWGIAFILSMTLNLNLLLFSYFKENLFWENLALFASYDDFKEVLALPDGWLFFKYLLSYLLWVPLLIMLPILVLDSRRDTPVDRKALVVILLAGVASAGIMVLSPTLYASANRPWYPFTVVALFVLGALLYPIAHRIPKPALFILYAIPAVQIWLLFYSWYMSGFNIHVVM